MVRTRKHTAMKSISELLHEGTSDLVARSSTPQLDAEVLLSFVLEQTREHLRAYPEALVAPVVVARFRGLVERRKGHEPIAYLIGEQEFWSLPFFVSPAVLIPRPETELLVELALHRMQDEWSIADLGTGSGCIAVSLAVESKRRGMHVSIIATDRSAEALAIAQRNAARHDVSDRIEFAQGSWWDGVGGSTFHLVVSNPPYIATGDPNVSPSIAFEPSGALYAPDAGLDDLRQIVGGASPFLRPGGTLLCEIGSNQGTFVEALDSAGLRFVGLHRDLAGHDRVAEWGPRRA